MENQGNITIDDVLAFLKETRSKFSKSGRGIKDVPVLLPAREKLEEAQKIIGEFLSDWKFWQQRHLVYKDR